MSQYKIGDLNIELRSSQYQFKRDKFTDLFFRECDCDEPDIVFDARVVRPEELGDMKEIRRTLEFDLVDIHERQFLVNHWARCRFGYGVYLDELKSDFIVPVYVNSDLFEEIPLTVNRFLSTIGLHSKLLQKGASVIHASYIACNDGAILFTAPSGTGKSTQAELWKRYAGAEIINGDRVLVRKSRDRWLAYGYPCSGSSQICRNETCPIQAIVVLEQGKENTVESMTASQKIRALVSATEVYPWNMNDIDLAFQCAQKITESIPVIRLVCRPDEDAVRVLQNYLEANDDAECV